MISLLKYLKPYKLQVVFVALFTLLGSMLELYLPTLMADVVDIGIVNSDITYILKIGVWMVVCSLLAILMTMGKAFFASRTSLAFGRDIRRELFVKVEHYSLEEFGKVGASSLITRTTNDVKQVQDVLNMMLSLMTRAPLMLIGGIVLAVYRDAKLSLIFVASLPILAGLIFLITRKAVPLFGVLQKKTDRLNLVLREGLTGVRVIRAFNRADHEKEKFRKANQEFRDTGIAVNRIMAFLFPVMMIMMNFTNIAIIWFGGIRIDQGDMQVGNLMAFLQYASMILFALIMLAMTFVMIPRAQASAGRINEVLLIKPNITDPKQPSEHTGLRGHVEFKGVTFRYAGAEKPVIEDISFHAKPGEMTAIIGSTGAGKTTILQLIPRFFDVEKGSVLVDGTDVRKMPQKELREKIGYVPQKASLFSGTIKENVLFGKEDATDEEVLEALETAQASEFVKEKENGIDSYIEQAGANLSGGQKQRLSIARALVRKPEIYLFDDSFSALDYKTDQKLRKTLKETTADAAVIIVAQRVSTITEADQIIVLNEGKIAGIGTHQQLLEENDIYQEIVASQQTEEESA
ncbi:ABC transporter ATP-binding protein [Bacillus glycinifermentans]|uniref:ABC transporter ATP-binding protein n=1 Tax=Bacillus glycinifermentans TaxID=1664069 RepID=A0A0T6BMG9_9BACI|nr:ABC transporter ATP-binding protein [Bacillus glycinifermentans]ATH91945.1 ABC transporter ATP-binding protein [Bacillus glycinifermentans]KRT92827.1 multidrug ABC transporter ATP-binding protein [Bacillus glycinifermentans]MEC0486194.1 ABC transporter ATP-binding protein [Bacillus glycinifermentans]